MNSEKLIWAAGFFDGEGTATVVRSFRENRNSCYSLSASIRQLDPTELYWYRESWGGYVGNYDHCPR